MVFEPDGLQGHQGWVFEIGDGLDVFAVEVVFHDIIEDFTFGGAVATQELKHEFIKSLVFEFVELKVVLAVF